MKTKVLVVDDERAIRELLRRLVEDLGCEPVLASSGTEALAILETERVDVVFTDIVMPDMNGRTLAMRVKEAYLSVRVVATSGNLLPRGEKGMFDGFVRRPFDLGELKGVLEERISVCSASRLRAYSRRDVVDTRSAESARPLMSVVRHRTER